MALFNLLLLNLNNIVKRIYDNGYLPMPRVIKERVNAVCGREGYQDFIANRRNLPEIFISQENYSPVYLTYDEVGVIVNSPLECATYVDGGWNPPAYEPIDMTSVFLDPTTTYPLIVATLIIIMSLLSVATYRIGRNG
tara:strand:+ start:569 stop:982 length:414 start_codon:yes stop_codon:yes gene_type:complete